MINGCALKCNGRPAFATTAPAEQLCFSAVIILQVGALVLGILGLLKVGPFANMPPAASYALIGVGGAIWLVDFASFCQRCIRDQKRSEKLQHLGEPKELDPEAEATFEAEEVVLMGQSKPQSAGEPN